MTDPLIGRVLDGRYRVDREIGAGGHGVVYEGFHLALARRIAIKVVDPPPDASQTKRAGFAERLLDEGRVLTQLRHPHVVSALDLGVVEIEHEKIPYLVMEWCDGEPLSQAIGRRGGRAFSVEEAFEIVRPLCDALAHAHALGIAHRDLKPSNVMLTTAEPADPRLIDFGIAKLFEDDDAGSGSTRTESGRSPYTPAYAAPEQVAGARTGPWTDVHALALLFVELVTGRPPYDDVDGVGAIDPIRPTPAERGVDVGPLEPVLARALALRPSDRHKDAGELGADLARAFTDRGARPLPIASERVTPTPGEPRALRDLTAPPSSQTLGGPSAPRAFRRVALAAVAVATLGAAALGASALWSEAPRAPGLPPTARLLAALASSRSATSPVPPSSPCARTLDSAKGRAVLAGWPSIQTSDSPEIRTLYLGRAGDESAMWSFHDFARLADVISGDDLDRVLREQVEGLRAGRGVAYGRKGACLITVAGPAAPATLELFKKLTEGDTFEVIGDNLGGPDPFAASQAAGLRLTETAMVARSVAGLSGAELETRILLTGWSPRVIQRDPKLTTVTLMNKRATMTVTLAHLDSARATDQAIRGLMKPSAYAVEGTVLVWAVSSRGGDPEAFLGDVLQGLGATITKTP